jgi:hypothetical protein
MTTDRITWTDCQRAAGNLADAARAANYPTPPETWRLVVQRGSVTNGHAGELYWQAPSGAVESGLPMPGGRSKLYRSAADSYQHLTTVAGTLRDVAAHQRQAERTAR